MPFGIKLSSLRPAKALLYLRLGPRVIRLQARPWVTNGLGTRLYLDPSDRRAWQMAWAAEGVFDTEAAEVWSQLIDRFAPRCVVDIGANYGEVGLGTRYVPDAAVYLIEANPTIASRLVKSAAGSGAVVIVAAASDEPGPVHLHVDGKSSGRSSIESVDKGLLVPAVRVDSFVTTRGRLAFKIDVEGHECAVLRGMERLLSEASEWVGLVENNDLSAVWDAIPFAYWIERDTMLLHPAETLRKPNELRTTKDILVSSHPLAADKLVKLSQANCQASTADE